MATPRIISDALIDEINNYLLTGCTIETACACCGLQPATYRSWIRRGRAEAERLDKPRTKPKDSEAIFLRFYELTTVTLAQVKARLIGEIAQSASGYPVEKVVEVYERAGDVTTLKERKVTKERARDWRAGAWLLERRYAGEFSATNRVEHSAGEGVIAIQINPPAAAATGEAVDPGAGDD